MTGPDPLAGVSPQTRQEANSAKNAEARGWFYAPEADLIQVVVREPDGSWTVCDPQPREA